jgi:membrane protease YdiL (CAAX protease family)
VEDTGAVIPVEPEPVHIQAASRPARAIPTWVAAIQAFLVSGIPTQLVLFVVLYFGLHVEALGPDGVKGGVSLEFIAMLLLFDTALTALLIRIVLVMSGEESRTVFLGTRVVWKEALLGLALVPVVLVGVNLVTYGLRAVFPWLHTVEQSPFLQYMGSPIEAAVFFVVVTLGGGVKEELQRAFILHRFERYLGGPRVGLAVFSGWFGILHYDQGLDVSVSIALLGLLWGVLYYKRRCFVMSMVNHATFNGVQVLAVLAQTLRV